VLCYRGRTRKVTSPARRAFIGISNLRGMLEAGRRQRNQPAPPHAVFEALTEPARDPDRQWLVLLDDEIEPL
jgi:hypothetical protein